MRRFFLLLFVLLAAVCLILPPAVSAQSASDQPVVQAVLFYSPSCSHCHKVITEILVPMVDEYGDQLQIIGIDITQAEGGALYQTAIEHYQIPSERRGVPTLIVGDTILVGSGEIPAEFPTMVEDLLAAGGISWPDIPGFTPDLNSEETQESSTEEEDPAPTNPENTSEPEVAPLQATAEPTETEAEPNPTNEPEVAALPAPTEAAPVTPSLLEVDEDALASAEAQIPPPDPVGMILAAIILLAMLAALLFALWRIVMAQAVTPLLGQTPLVYATTWLIPILSLLGLGVSIYLAYVEISQVEAVCGPIGHCNAVQSSSYARIMGVPIAVLGLLNYVTIMILWGGQRVAALANLSTLALMGLTLFGTLFSIYLTLLEIFVIQAICAWCLSSAVISMMLMLLVVVPVTNKSPQLQGALSH